MATTTANKTDNLSTTISATTHQVSTTSGVSSASSVNNNVKGINTTIGNGSNQQTVDQGDTSTAQSSLDIISHFLSTSSSSSTAPMIDKSVSAQPTTTISANGSTASDINRPTTQLVAIPTSSEGPAVGLRKRTVYIREFEGVIGGIIMKKIDDSGRRRRRDTLEFYSSGNDAVFLTTESFNLTNNAKIEKTGHTGKIRL